MCRLDRRSCRPSRWWQWYGSIGSTIPIYTDQLASTIHVASNLTNSVQFDSSYRFSSFRPILSVRFSVTSRFKPIRVDHSRHFDSFLFDFSCQYWSVPFDQSCHFGSVPIDFSCHFASFRRPIVPGRLDTDQSCLTCSCRLFATIQLIVTLRFNAGHFGSTTRAQSIQHRSIRFVLTIRYPSNPSRYDTSCLILTLPFDLPGRFTPYPLLERDDEVYGISGRNRY